MATVPAVPDLSKYLTIVGLLCSATAATLAVRMLVEFERSRPKNPDAYATPWSGAAVVMVWLACAFGPFVAALPACLAGLLYGAWKQGVHGLRGPWLLIDLVCVTLGLPGIFFTMPFWYDAVVGVFPMRIPHDLKAEALRDAPSLRVTWSGPAGFQHGYELVYSSRRNVPDDVADTITPEEGRHHFGLFTDVPVNGLLPGTAYRIWVASSTGKRRSAWAGPVEATTFGTAPIPAPSPPVRQPAPAVPPVVPPPSPAPSASPPVAPPHPAPAQTASSSSRPMDCGNPLEATAVRANGRLTLHARVGLVGWHGAHPRLLPDVQHPDHYYFILDVPPIPPPITEEMVYYRADFSTDNAYFARHDAVFVGSHKVGVVGPPVACRVTNAGSAPVTELHALTLTGIGVVLRATGQAFNSGFRAPRLILREVAGDTVRLDLVLEPPAPDAIVYKVVTGHVAEAVLKLPRGIRRVQVGEQVLTLPPEER